MDKVLIYTLTTEPRIHFLRLCADRVKSQTYKNIKWVVFDNSKQESEEIKKLCKENDADYYFLNSHPIGKLRNMCNDIIYEYYKEYEYIAVFDDDDYYFNYRIETTLKELKDSKKLIGGHDAVIIYDINLDRSMLCCFNNKSHATNNTFIYHRNYLKNHRYDDKKTYGEETEFLQNFSVDMCQVNFQTMINIGHLSNTCKKQKLFELMYHLNNGSPYREITLKDKTILNPYINLTLTKERHLIYEDYDIEYYLSGLHVYQDGYDPFKDDLGGSEQAVREIGREWVKLGKKVCVYGLFKQTGEKDGVIYKNFYNFQFWKKHRNVIIWRFSHMAHLINADKLILDLHDITAPNLNIDLFDKIMVKSQHHKDFLLMEYIDKYDKIKDKIEIIPNGVMSKYTFDEKKERDFNKFIYASSWDRGLTEIITHFWTQYIKLNPEAHLYIYYGTHNKDLENNIKKLVEKNVNIHLVGRVNSNILLNELQTAGYLLYPNNTPAETDCLNVRQSILCGCFPILLNYGVYREHEERYNIKLYNLDIRGGDRMYKLLAHKIHEEKPKLNKEIKRNDFDNWDYIAKKWLEIIN